MTKADKKWWRTTLISHPMGHPYLIQVSVDDEVVWEWFSNEDSEKATEIYNLLEDFKVNLKAKRYELKKIFVGAEQ